VLLHEPGVPREVIALARRDAERVMIRRVRGRAPSAQRLAEFVARHARGGKLVCVLRAGDPYARGAAEGRWLDRSGLRHILIRPAP
jgi:siroheme synthase